MTTTGRKSIITKNLLEFLLVFGFIIGGNAFQQEQLSSCRCSVKESWSIFRQSLYNGLHCEYIDTAEKVGCAKRFITDNSLGIDMVKLYNSNISLFPDDFFPTFNVTDIEFRSCEMVVIPSGLLQPLCPSLLYIVSLHGILRSKSIPINAFGNCKKLQKIWIFLHGITTVSRKAFSGLVDLRELHLNSNAIESFEGLDGVHNLKILFLNNNRIRSIDQNAFRGLSKLKRVILQSNKLTTLAEGVFDPFINNKGLIMALSGNPFYCNCSLKWFQDWLQKSNITQFKQEFMPEPQCAAPMNGTMRTLNFCPITPTELPKPEEKTSTRIPSSITTLTTVLANDYGQTYDALTWPIGLLACACILSMVALSSVLVVWVKLRKLEMKCYARRRMDNMDSNYLIPVLSTECNEF